MIRCDYFGVEDGSDMSGSNAMFHSRLWPTLDELLDATRRDRLAAMLDILRGTATVSAVEPANYCTAWRNGTLDVDRRRGRGARLSKGLVV